MHPHAGACGRKTLHARQLRCRSNSVDLVLVHNVQEPAGELAKKAVAAFAAAAVALTPLAASATGGGIMPSRNRAEDEAARSFMDSKGAERP